MNAWQQLLFVRNELFLRFCPMFQQVLLQFKHVLQYNTVILQILSSQGKGL